MTLQSFRNTFAGNPLDRVSERRSDPEWVAGRLADADSLAVAIWNGKPLVESDGSGGVRIAYFPAELAKELSGGEERLLFLGMWREQAVFALDIEGSADPAEGPLRGVGAFEDLRAISLRLVPADAAILATAKQMFEWRRRHRFCASCGQPSDAVDGGWKRRCRACGVEHFPRTDPVVIMLPYFGDRCMVGRGASWPEGRYSALAGFLEPGETIEEACARELHEEAGLRTVRVHYHSTQPWPYPSSLMIGLLAEVADDQAAPDQTELSEVRWFTREEARALLDGEIADATAPGQMAIAHQLLRAWVDGGSPGD
ncbi:MAG: NAD(+) diphosphatase [Phenylobacterium sp.]|uniref:NAD(+) diphosphatase n=1 Tax=Phenylobacterium sp. TaxID=1871053 RepID=UPI002734DFE7|nr:NAD(+) diphosphatase [Phenylobacterium sp.]MDP3172932.1 NAD(+) diphosphatase [Phenylobacterium sp.]